MKMINVLLFTFLLFIGGCGPGTTTGNPLAPVEVRMEDRQPFAWIKKGWDALIPPAHAVVSNVKFCFKRLRFKPDSITNGSNFDLILGEVNINPSGTNLITVSIPQGTYQRIEFDLEKECDGTLSKPSVTFTNNNGTFSTLDHTTIKFDGNYVVSAAGTLTLNIDALLDALDLVNNSGQIKTSLEGAPGDF